MPEAVIIFLVTVASIAILTGACTFECKQLVCKPDFENRE